ncbi:MAG: phosphohydrolase [Flavobacteriaceae bacterium]|nr:MAG: phosphohydrolase [Flavobacteriaceae bacterium]
MRQKLKIFNDPVHGFVNIPNNLLFEIIESRYFQRLRRISQTGLTHYVYPGARHSRFHHALGCLHLMQEAIQTLRKKSVDISDEEEQGVLLAILLHDVGHGPFSHSLEQTLVVGVHHEEISLAIMHKLNQEFNGELTLAIQIFKGEYPKFFLTQLVASQLDIDRLDYLKRDSFFTGVAEGNINPNRIISMMNVHQNQLVIDAKGIYSVEQFLISRTFMYWQVYFHKNSISAELYMVSVLRRAKELVKEGQKVEAPLSLQYFLNHKDLVLDDQTLEHFLNLDDFDLMYAIKLWQNHSDKILSKLSKMVMGRILPVSKISENAMEDKELEKKKAEACKLLDIKDASYFVHQTSFKVKPYSKGKYPISLLYKNGQVKDLIESQHNIMGEVLQRTVEKFHQCYLNKAKIDKLNL